jgi:hypothetical protein
MSQIVDLTGLDDGESPIGQIAQAVVASPARSSPDSERGPAECSLRVKPDRRNRFVPAHAHLGQERRRPGHWTLPGLEAPPARRGLWSAPRGRWRL